MNKPLHETYLRWGRAALDHCKWTFIIGASNKEDDRDRTGGWWTESVRRLRAETKATSYEEAAAEAEEARCGNCGEQAAAAYFYLKNTFGARPLDLMKLNPARRAIHAGAVSDGDHVFVLIGRTGSDPTARKEWGVESVICDPWAGVVCAAYEYAGKGVCGFAWHQVKSVEHRP